MRHITKLVGLAACIAATVSCGDLREGQSPVFLVINSLTPTVLNSDVLKLVTSGGTCTLQAPCPTVVNDLAQATFSLSLKNITASPSTPTSNTAVTITRVHVEYRRADGRNTPGVDVPFPFDAGLTVTFQSSSSVVSFEIVRFVAKEESPLVQLINSPNVISAIATVTFYGKDQVGNDVRVTGSIQVNFGNFGDS
jgi:hypothetical protein